MKHWYQKPNQIIAGYIRKVLILKESAEPVNSDRPVFTNGMPALFCKTEKDNQGNDRIICLALFGRSVPEEFIFKFAG
ncbi:MAG TPA: hypothetical protein VKB95_12940 [Chitinophagaceae bacterium]|nr:hypothetical protein [Chitinophagaceae bacterium]